MNSFNNQLTFLHNLLPYFPAQSRTLFFFLLYYMELKQMIEEFKRESDYLSSAPPNPNLPDMDTLISLLTKDLPKNDVEKIRRMIETFKMMEMMENMSSKDTAGSKNDGNSFDYSNNNSSRESKSNGFNTEMLKKMMSKSQMDMFEKYQDMFKYE